MGMEHDDDAVIARLRAMARQPFAEATVQAHLGRARTAAARGRRRARIAVTAACLTLLSAPAAALAVGALDERAPTRFGMAADRAPTSGDLGQTCRPVDQSTEEVLTGVTLTWDSSFLCGDAPGSGSYKVVVSVTNAATSAQGVTIQSLELTHTTPRPQRDALAASGSAQGLPLAVSAGQAQSFSISGTYGLVETDEGFKSNLHLRATGTGAASGRPFELGINVHVRDPGARESGPADGGPPAGEECASPPGFAGVPGQPASPAQGVVPSPRAGEATSFAESRAACSNETSPATPPGSVPPVPARSADSDPDGLPERGPAGPPPGAPDGPPPGARDDPPDRVADGPAAATAGPPDWMADPVVAG